MSNFAFIAPYMLFGLFLLPLFYWLMRIKPIKPEPVIFPAFTLLASLTPQEETPKGIPLFMLLFRLCILSLLILGFSGPVLFPKQTEFAKKQVYIIDNGWSATPNWSQLQKEVLSHLEQAKKQNALIKLIFTATPSNKPSWISPETAEKQIKTQTPNPWPVQRLTALQTCCKSENSESTGLFWFSDGLASNQDKAFSEQLKKTYTPQFFNLYQPVPNKTAHALTPPVREQNGISIQLLRAHSDKQAHYTIFANDLAQYGLFEKEITLDPGKKTVKFLFKLPDHITNNIVSIQTASNSSAGNIVLVDRNWKRPDIGLVLPSDSYESRPYLSDLYYLKKALSPFINLKEAPLSDLLKKNLDGLIMIDEARNDTQEIQDYIKKGGFLIRFSGSKLANHPDSLTPVKLRKGKHVNQGSLNWNKPTRIEPFKINTPYYGIEITEPIFVYQQILAEPGLDLSNYIWANLSDGSPLITSKPFGKGRIVLFHIRPHPDWSDLPMSNLFVQILRKTLDQIHNKPKMEYEDGLYFPTHLINADGQLYEAAAQSDPIRLTPKIGMPDVKINTPPGLYQGKQGEIALNIMHQDSMLIKINPHLFSAQTLIYGHLQNINLGKWLLGLAFIFLILDGLLMLYFSGKTARLTTFVRSSTPIFLICICYAVLFLSSSAYGQTNPPSKSSPSETDFPQEILRSLNFGYIKTHHPKTDQISQEGLEGLIQILSERSSIEANSAIGIDIEKDSLKPFPIIYWPITSQMSELSQKTAKKISSYLINGGLIVF